MGQSSARAPPAGAWVALASGPLDRARSCSRGVWHDPLVPWPPRRRPDGCRGRLARVAARPSAGCALSPGGQAWNDRTSCSQPRAIRVAIVREVPPSYTGRMPLPVVIDLHGWSEPAAFQVQVSQLGTYGAAHRFITITPQVAESRLRLAAGVLRQGRRLRRRAAAHRRHDVVRRPQPRLRDRLFLRRVPHLDARVRRRRPDRSGGPGRRDTEPGGVPSVAPGPSRRLPRHGRPVRAVRRAAIGPASLSWRLPRVAPHTRPGPRQKAATLKGPTIPANTAAWARRNGCAPGPANRDGGGRRDAHRVLVPEGQRGGALPRQRRGPRLARQRDVQRRWPRSSATPRWRSRPTRSCGPSSRPIRCAAEGSRRRWRPAAPEHAQHDPPQPARWTLPLRGQRLALAVAGERAAQPPVPPAAAGVADVVGHRRQLLPRFARPLALRARAHRVSLARARRVCSKVNLHRRSILLKVLRPLRRPAPGRPTRSPPRRRARPPVPPPRRTRWCGVQAQGA